MPRDDRQVDRAAARNLADRAGPAALRQPRQKSDAVGIAQRLEQAGFDDRRYIGTTLTGGGTAALFIAHLRHYASIEKRADLVKIGAATSFHRNTHAKATVRQPIGNYRKTMREVALKRTRHTMCADFRPDGGT